MKNEEIRAMLEEIKSCALDLVKDDEPRDYFVDLVKLDAAIKAIEKEVASIEAECERQKNQASKLRKLWGSSFYRGVELEDIEHANLL